MKWNIGEEIRDPTGSTGIDGRKKKLFKKKIIIILQRFPWVPLQGLENILNEMKREVRIKDPMSDSGTNLWKKALKSIENASNDTTNTPSSPLKLGPS